MFFMSYRGGIQNLGKPELEKVMQRRKLDAEGRPGSIKGGVGSSTTADGELAAQLARRSHLIEEVRRWILFFTSVLSIRVGEINVIASFKVTK